MDSNTAREILTHLIDGLDPETGQSLPADSILHRARVMRALLAAVAALQTPAARRPRRTGLPSKVGHPWDPAEEVTLLEGYRSGATVGELARAHERTHRSIQLRLERLGLKGSTALALSQTGAAEPRERRSPAANRSQ